MIYVELNKDNRRLEIAVKEVVPGFAVNTRCQIEYSHTDSAMTCSSLSEKLSNSDGFLHENCAAWLRRLSNTRLFVWLTCVYFPSRLG